MSQPAEDGHTGMELIYVEDVIANNNNKKRHE